jgi:hypothetical protein
MNRERVVRGFLFQIHLFGYLKIDEVYGAVMQIYNPHFAHGLIYPCGRINNL